MSLCVLLGLFQELLSLLFLIPGYALALFRYALYQDFAVTIGLRLVAFDFPQPQRRVKYGSRRSDPGC
jgi:hypothetical protein